MTSDDAGAKSSLQRGVAILRLLADSNESGARLTDIARDLGLTPPTVHRILKTLVEEGMVESDKTTKRYRLGIDLFTMAARAGNPNNLRDICRPIMLRLSATLRDTIFLLVRSGFDAVCLDRSEGPFPIRSFTGDIGGRVTLGVGQGSLAILAFLPDEEREWTLDAARKRRSESISLKPCPRCYAHCRPWDRTCKSCGYTFAASEVSREPEQVDGELVRLDPAKMKAMRLAAAKDRRCEEGMCRTYAKLRDLGIRRGYQPGWAYMKWIGRGGSPAEAR